MNKSDKRLLRSDNFGRWFVLTLGSDCDGMSGFGLSAYHYKDDALKSAEESAEWSDGQTYKVTSDLRLVMDYCENWDREFINHVLIEPININ